ncbi:hypothetical protein TgHK011_002217 [Trichoderma gracile]|nr:hypothetical protein TgHK011_002217 [Trichoderma gracile]
MDWPGHSFRPNFAQLQDLGQGIHAAATAKCTHRIPSVSLDDGKRATHWSRACSGIGSGTKRVLGSSLSRLAARWAPTAELARHLAAGICP